MESTTIKNFPANYSQKVLEILSALSLTDLKDSKLVGSSAQRSQLYAGDYDAFETVKATSASSVASGLKDVVKSLRAIEECYIGDIKCGEVPDWNPFSKNARVDNGKVLDFNPTQSQAIVDKLRSENIITPKEASDAAALLKHATTPFGFLAARKEIRWFILRWKPENILNESLIYRGHTFLLEDAIESGGMVKVDAIGNIHDRFTEFSMIYDIFIKGKRVSATPTNPIKGLCEDVVYYEKASPFKALKRLFALAKIGNNPAFAKELVPILNSDLGRLYQIIGDLKTIETLLERPKHPMDEILSQIDEMKHRMGNIYQLRDFLAEEHDIIGEINSILKSPMKTIIGKIERLIDRLTVILDDAAMKILMSHVEKTKSLMCK